MKILVTGGLGFIGSHTIVELYKSNHTVIVVDNLSNTKIEVLDKIEKLIGEKLIYHNIDVTDENKMESIFKSNKIEGVIHFAGFKSVSESISKPLEYYNNNILSTINLSKLCIKYGVKKLVFSSSATVYGDQKSPLKEDDELKKTANPYGETKAICERILMDTVNANDDFFVTLLRYFNPIGAHNSALIGENPNGIPNNLMPYITKVASGKLDRLYVFGNDYNTKDGTGIRDYIHVVDLAKGHVKAIEKMKKGTNIYNLGTGKGTSVFELINKFTEINGVKIPFEVVDRRKGDIAECFADVTKAKHELEWRAELTLNDMVRDVWRFEKENS